MHIDRQAHDTDAQFQEKFDQRKNRHVKRAKPSRKRGGTTSTAGSPGGIRQRRNKRWNW